MKCVVSSRCVDIQCIVASEVSPTPSGLLSEWPCSMSGCYHSWVFNVQPVVRVALSPEWLLSLMGIQCATLSSERPGHGCCHSQCKEVEYGVTSYLVSYDFK